MKTIQYFVGMAIIVIAFFFCTLPAFSREAKVTKKNVPAAVITAFEKSYPTAKAKGYMKEKEGNRVAYEIESMVGLVHQDVLYYADGTLIVDEESIKVADLPNVVKKSIQTAYPKGKIQSAEKPTKSSGVGYEAIIKSGGKTYEVEFDAAGKVVNTDL